MILIRTKISVILSINEWTTGKTVSDENGECQYFWQNLYYCVLTDCIKRWKSVVFQVLCVFIAVLFLCHLLLYIIVCLFIIDCIFLPISNIRIRIVIVPSHLLHTYHLLQIWVWINVKKMVN